MVIELSEPNTFSIYIHIPFCKRKCDYCHFYVIPDKEQYKDLLLESLKREWDSVLQKVPSNFKLKSIYFGGGTPSLFGPNRVDAVVQWIKKSYPEHVEVTLEANPEEVTRRLISDYKDAGINRLSMGVQSLDDRELQLLTRRHDAKKAVVAIDEATHAGVNNISIDLMYDLPHQTPSSWKATIDRACTLPITHLSLYNLTIEPHTVFYKYREQLSKDVPDESASYEMYAYAVDTLNAAGLKQYEISAFAKDDLYSRHNTGYWTGRPFLGLGPSAYSFWEGIRYKNIANLNKYSQLLQNSLDPVDTIDELSVEDRRKELFVIALRLLDGVDIAKFEEINGPLSKETIATIDHLTERNLLVKTNDRVKLSSKGLLLYDSIATELI